MLLVGFFVFAAIARAEVTFCLPGPGAGQCNGPVGIDVDVETGRVYVADSGNNRVNVFESDGTSLPPIGAGLLNSPSWVAVDNVPTSASHHDIYVTTGGGNFLVQKFKANGEYVEAESFGNAGTGPCEFDPNDPIAVGPDGDIYVANSYDKDGPGGQGDFFSRIIVFDSAGNCDKEVPTSPTPLFEGDQAIRNFAVDSVGSIYVTVAGAGGVIRKYGPSGELLSELDKGIETEGLAVDDADDLFAKQRGLQVTKPASIFFFTEYSPSGEILRRFNYILAGSFVVPDLAAYSSLDGDLYASEGAAGITYLDFPPSGPVLVPEACHVKTGTLGSVKATLQAEVNPEGKASTFHFEYLTQAQFEDGGFANPEVQKSPETALGGAPDFELHEAAFQGSDLKPETKYHCRVVAENSDSASPAIGNEGTFITEEGFGFGAAWAAEVGVSTATLKVEGNPLGLAAKGEIEYVEDTKYQTGEFTQALKAPPGEIDFGSGETMQLRSIALSGLIPGTLYHWRLRAKNGNPFEGIVCPQQAPGPCPENEHTFRTYLPEPNEVDSRQYELVSPSEKNSAEVAVPGIAGGVFEDRSIRIQAGATSGEAITYTSWTSFGPAAGAPATSQYLSIRNASGWETENISPFGVQASVLVPPYGGFTPDLRFGGFQVKQPALVPGCPDGFESLYLRDGFTGKLLCLTPEEPSASSTTGCSFAYAGTNADGGRAFFASGASYVGAPVAQGFSLYEWSAESGLRLVSILPNGEPAEPTFSTSFGPGGGNCQIGQKVQRHAVSTDGTRVFWTYVPTAGPSQLLVRVNGIETRQLDAKQSGSGASGNGIFRAASADGSVVYFTDENRLISGSKSEPGEPDLYLYAYDNPQPLTNLTKGAVPGDVRGVVGTSDDGSYVYFVAGAILSGEEENSAGLKAQADKDNLYLFHEGQIKFIATLAPNDPADATDWTPQPKELSARVSPDGRHLAFLTAETKALAGYDNRVETGEHCQYEPVLKKLIGGPLCSQVFLYDADSADLTCASCNPSGSRPLGPTLLPGWTNMYEGPRYLSDDGSRLYFESYDALLPGDESDKRDVFEFELLDAGSCSAQNPNFDPASGGCHFLISSGKSPDESYLLDASASGRDAFFATRRQMVGWDRNDNFDVYDYREGGGFPEPSEVPPVCAGESCLQMLPPQPPRGTRATPSFNGPDNAKPKKHKHRKKHSMHHNKKHKHKHQRAGR